MNQVSSKLKKNLSIYFICLVLFPNVILPLCKKTNKGEMLLEISQLLCSQDQQMDSYSIF